ncbi:hypothetical protein ONZ51_g4563 [Trametes cubensis]|uniref:Uncharacterized protein n=1 Tax=Trametes cubensis TaxID=1111947 RepID=A0AAD7TW41_9APHY|nr:hypothetical protein ONZ51_g4563 [Trametes cubensis]
MGLAGDWQGFAIYSPHLPPTSILFSSGLAEDAWQPRAAAHDLKKTSKTARNLVNSFQAGLSALLSSHAYVACRSIRPLGLHFRILSTSRTRSVQPQDYLGQLPA